MKVLIVGGGAREHALVRSAKSAGHVVHCAPGNAGIARDAATHTIKVDDLDGLEALCERERFDLVVVGPEAPLVAGLADRLRARGVLVFGPGRDYHWYRQDSTGCWSHKPGSTAVRNVDNAGSTISDPMTCNRGPYTDFCTYMVTKRGVIIK